MKQGQLRRQLLLTVATLALLAVTLSGATFAWFSSNRTVNTSRAEARAGTEELKLLVSSSAGGPFEEVCDIAQINTAKPDQLQPVSTADLTAFYYCPTTQNDLATRFLPVEGEKYYYHGRIYLQAQAEGEGWQGQTMAVYLDADEEAGPLVSADGQLLTAARLGLRCEGAQDKPVILRLSEEANPLRSEMNTAPGGSKAGKGVVITGEASTAPDPSVPLESVLLAADADTLPEQPLLHMELNTVYPLDIYFYLEGCDPDCNETISTQTCELYLGFFGMVDGEGGAA